MNYWSCGLTTLLLSASGAAQAAPTIEEMWDTIKKQQAEIEQLKNQQQANDTKIEATADAIENTTSTSTSWADKTTLGGYGEHHFNNVQGGSDMVDAHRYVLFVSHQYSDTIRFISEFELEHGLAGEGKPGEVELEQALIEWQYSNNHKVSIGQFLLPVGILNETHEPETFYGTERNAIEKNIIPTTWWETGVMLSGQIGPSLSYDLAVHSGLKTTAASGIRSGRQKSAKAVANDLAYTGRIKYTPVPGFTLAATVQHQSDMTQDSALEPETATFATAHGVYQAGGFSLKALYAQWDIDGADYTATGQDQQSGYYVESGYKVIENLGLFVRYNAWNNTAADTNSEDKETVELGLNFWLHPRVVLKADYQSGQSDNTNDIANLGVGWSF